MTRASTASLPTEGCGVPGEEEAKQAKRRQSFVSDNTEIRTEKNPQKTEVLQRWKVQQNKTSGVQ